MLETTPEAENYNPEADIDDGSCTYGNATGGDGCWEYNYLTGEQEWVD